MSARHAKVLIIGSGPAGYTAAIYAARALLEPVLISGFQPGGQLMITTDVENYPGFAQAVQGPWLMDQMQRQAEHMGVAMVADHIVEARLSEPPFELHGETGVVYSCDALIIATGAQARWLGLESEERFKGFGVSACATCDGFFFRGKDVAVIGGGNSAAEEALYLANLASSVTVVHRRDQLRAERILQERLRKNPKISLVFDTVVDEILGGGAPLAVTGLRLRNVRSGELWDQAADGVFVAIGHHPATSLFAGQIAMKPSGYIVTEPYSTATSVPGVFAAGDVADDIYRQAVTAAGFGCMAALEAERWLTARAADRQARA